MTPAADILQGMYLDGDRPVLHMVTLALRDDRRLLVIVEDGVERARWPYDDLRALPDQAGRDQLILHLVGDTTARLMLLVPDDMARIRAIAGNLERRPPDPRRRRLAAWATGAFASVLLIVFVLVPVMADQLARFLPPEGEKALGDATLHQIRTALDETGFGELPVCDNAAGLAALRKIESRLLAGTDLPIDLTLQVLDSSIVNAFALPGGYVILFDGLIEEAKSAEEVAAVFAHELGHVVARDPTRIALRSAGSIGVLGLLFGDFAGGALVLFLAERMIQADYTREAEAAADTFAHDLLTRADLPPAAIATFFERLLGEGGDEKGIVAHFMSHPALGDRIAAARAATPAGQVTRPLLDAKEWRALRAICD